MLFNISQIAKLLKLSPNTLRNWEKRGLLMPQRSNGNQRLYSKQDLYRIRYILYLNRERKIPMNDIPKFLNNPINEPLYMKQEESENQLTGIKWKEERLNRGISLKELSKNTGISVSYLSKIENGAHNVSMDILTKLADFYKKNILYYYTNPQQENSTLIKRNDRSSFFIDIPGVHVEKLGQSDDQQTNIMLYTIEKGAERIDPHKHNGFEIVFVNRGEITFFLDKEVFDLEQGDTLQFSSERMHSWRNNLTHETELIWLHIS